MFVSPGWSEHKVQLCQIKHTKVDIDISHQIQLEHDHKNYKTLLKTRKFYKKLTNLNFYLKSVFILGNR